MAATFDTLKYAKQLEQAGVPESQAEIHAEALRGVLEEQIAARFDRFDDHLGRLESDLETIKLDLAGVKSELAIVKSELAMVRWLMGSVLIGVILLLIRAFWPV